MKTFTRNHRTSSSYSEVLNLTLTKSKIIYDTAVIPSNQLPEMTLYDYESSIYDEKNVLIDESLYDSRFANVTFDTGDYYTEYTVRKMKINDLFGIIGGVMVFLFLGLGAAARSFNYYRLRYLIGTKLYFLRPKLKTVSARMRILGKPDNNDQ